MWNQWLTGIFKRGRYSSAEPCELSRERRLGRSAGRILLRADAGLVVQGYPHEDCGLRHAGAALAGPIVGALADGTVRGGGDGEDSAARSAVPTPFSRRAGLGAKDCLEFRRCGGGRSKWEPARSPAVVLTFPCDGNSISPECGRSDAGRLRVLITGFNAPQSKPCRCIGSPEGASMGTPITIVRVGAASSGGGG